MSEPYIIAFSGGSSGRFISYIIWSLLSNNTTDFLMNEENSAHSNKSSWGMGIEGVEDGTDVDIYEKFKFVPESPFNILLTHVFPKFDMIYERYPKAKIIIIIFELSDFIEVKGNSLIKNTLSNNFRCIKEQQEAEMDLEHITKEIFKKNILKKDITQDQIQHILEIWYSRTVNIPRENRKHNKSLVFLDPILNTSYEQLLIIPYQEIYFKNNNGEYVGLKKLEDFSGIKANEITKKNYEKYVKDRDIFIPTKMPWLLKNKTLNN